MAQQAVQRLGTSLSWSLSVVSRSRSRSVMVTFSSDPKSRRSERHASSSRTFSTATRRSQAAAPAPSSKIAADKATKATAATSQGAASSRTGNSNFPTARHEATSPSLEPIRDVTKGLSDQPFSQPSDNAAEHIDWTKSFHGMSAEPFSKEAADVLLQPINEDDVEVKPDGIVYLPEIKYRRILNRAFGPGGWGLAPRGETIVTSKSVTREYALLANGRLVSIARGEQDYFDPEGIATATEGCKSNALMRCCKDLGVASELWDPRFIRRFLAAKAREAWVEHAVTKKRRKISLRKDDEVRYPYKEVKGTGASGAFA